MPTLYLYPCKPRSVLLRAVYLCLLILLAVPARAQDRGAQPTRFDISATGTHIAGNVRQTLMQSQAHLSRSTARSGYDVQASAFRLWIRPAPGADAVRVGDDLAVAALPFLYLGEKPFLLGTARFERSVLRQVDDRVNAGIAVGLAPVRREDRLLRVALGAHVERTSYADAALEPSWVEDAAQRTVPRIALQGNGWSRRSKSPVSGRFTGAWMVNPTMWRDMRGQLDAAVDVRLVQTFSVRLSGSVIHDTVVPASVQPTDLRTTIGLAWSAPRPAQTP